ncbi:uncharacterized protein LOC131151563, partial [Malania oleifera]|uniref:uncharacterized protein LOC131151563 n=1 Tax=Malania oleifera TaxID=397392 RepID=UPI0025AE6EFF
MERMDSRDENVKAEGREDSVTSSEEEIDTSKVLLGRLDPMATENWVQEIEEIMVVLDCTDEQKVCYAAFKMTGEAKRWWLSVKLLEDQRVIKIAFTWERFKELFFDRYFPSSVREEKIKEFTNLTQGDMTVVEYEAKFVELSCFAPFLIPNEIRKARKFEKGLRRRIYKLVVGFQVQSFSKVVYKASVLEKSIQSSTESLECGKPGHVGKDCQESLSMVSVQNEDRGKQQVLLGRCAPPQLYTLQVEEDAIREA